MFLCMSRYTCVKRCVKRIHIFTYLYLQIFNDIYICLFLHLCLSLSLSKSLSVSISVLSISMGERQPSTGATCNMYVGQYTELTSLLSEEAALLRLSALCLRRRSPELNKHRTRNTVYRALGGGLSWRYCAGCSRSAQSQRYSPEVSRPVCRPFACRPNGISSNAGNRDISDHECTEAWPSIEVSQTVPAHKPCAIEASLLEDFFGVRCNPARSEDKRGGERIRRPCTHQNG